MCFCGKAKNEVAILVAGLDAHICEMCIEQAHHIIKEEFDTKKKDAKGLFTAQKTSPLPKSKLTLMSMLLVSMKQKNASQSLCTITIKDCNPL